MQNEIEIKLVDFSDLPKIYELQKESYKQEAEIYNDYSIQPLTQTLEDVQHEYKFMKIYKAVYNGEIIGSVRGYKDGNICNVGKLFVDPRFQNRGIGSKLLLEMEERFKDCSKFILFTGFMSFKNLYVYEKAGYKEFDRQVISQQFTFVFLEKIRTDRIVSNQVAVVAGASGLVGSELIKILLADDFYTKVIAIVRKPIDLEHKKLEQRMVDYNSLSESMKGLNATYGFCCLGTTINKAGSKSKQFIIDHDYVIDFALACKKIGVLRFAVVSSIGANRRSGNFYLKTKGEMEEDLKQLMLKRLLIVRPSLLLGNRSEFRFGEKVATLLIKAFGFMMIGGLKKFKPVTAKKVARYLAEMIKEKESGIEVVESCMITLG